MLNEQMLLIALAAFLCAGTIKGLVGIGLPTASIAVLSQFADPRIAIALLLLPALATNVWQVFRTRYLLRGLRLFWPFAGMLMITIWIFSRFAAEVPVHLLTLGIGCVIVLFVATNLFARPFALSPRFDFPAQIGTGAAAGVMGGLTAIWAPPMVMYLLARGLPKDEFVGATGVIVLVGTVPLTIGYWQEGLLTPALAGYSAAMIVPTLTGFAIGEWLRARLDNEQFRHVILGVFLLMGLNLIRRAVM